MYITSCVLCVYHIILSLTLSILLRLRPSHRRVFDVCTGRCSTERLESLEPLRWIKSFKATTKETSLYTIKYQDFLKVILIALILLIFFPISENRYISTEVLSSTACSPQWHGLQVLCHAESDELELDSNPLATEELLKPLVWILYTVHMAWIEQVNMYIS